MPEAHGNKTPFSSDEQGNAAEIGQSSETSTGSENTVLKHKTSGFPKADAVLGYGEEDIFTPKKSMIDLVTPPKASHEKRSLQKLFHRKGSRESTTPPSSSSGKNPAGRMTISAPTLVDASPDAKVLLNSASSLVDASPDAKNVVNYSRPIARHSSSEVSNKSPIVHGHSRSALHNSNPISGPSASPQGHNDTSGNINVGLSPSLVGKGLACNRRILTKCRSMTIPAPQLYAETKLLMSMVLFPRPSRPRRIQTPVTVTHSTHQITPATKTVSNKQ